MNVLVIGSCLFDVILALENNKHVKVEGDRASFELGDKVPVDIKAFTIGGNAPNVTSSLHKLSVSSEFYTYLGDDALSRYIKTKLSEEGISMSFEEMDSSTGPLSLIFDFTTDRTIFSHHPEFNHGFDSSKLQNTPTHIFLTSIGDRWERAYESVLSYALEKIFPLLFLRGLLQMKNMNETFIKTVHQSKMLFCNMEEAQLIHKTLTQTDIENPKEMLLNLKNVGFELLSITDGANGAYAADKEGKILKIDAVKPEGHEKTGAGDAYAGAFLASYIQGKNIPECMKRGVLNSAGVMSHIGAHTGQLTIAQMDEKSTNTNVTVSEL